jgi:hypothetical protein
MKLLSRLCVFALLIVASSMPAEARRFQSFAPPLNSAVESGLDNSGNHIVLVSGSTELTTEQFNEMLKAATEDTAPSNPSGSALPSIGMGTWLFIFGLFAALVRLVLWCLALSRGAVRVTRGASSAFSHATSLQQSRYDEDGAISERMEERIAQAAAAYASSGNTVTKSSTGPTSGQNGFGRRN